MSEAPSPPPTIDCEDVGFERGAALLIEHALAAVAPGTELGVRGTASDLADHLDAWCRARGHRVARVSGDVAWIVRGGSDRWTGAQRAGAAAGTSAHADARWSFAARGALVETGAPAVRFALDRRDALWSDDAPRLYAQAAAAQWDPATAIPWAAATALPPAIDAAVAQVMTYLVENENAALTVTARFLAQVHPHYREVQQVLAIQAADEARHAEVFTRRATLTAAGIGRSPAAGRASLATLLEDNDFAVASFLLGAMGEGTFLTLLAFIDAVAPDPATRRIAQLVGQDEARHVAYALGHLKREIEIDPGLRARLVLTARRRSTTLGASGGNEDALTALTLLAAGGWSPQAIARGHARVQELRADMDRGRRARLTALGFTADDAAALSAMHTPNFM